MFARTRKNASSDAGEVDIFIAVLVGIFGTTLLILAAIFVGIIFATVNTPSAGTVVDKDFTAAHCGFVGKVYLCYDDEWEFKIKNDTEHKEGWVEVSHTAYNTVQLGEWYDTKQG